MVCHKLSQTINTRAADIKRKGRGKVGKKDNDDYQDVGDDNTSIGLQKKSDSD